MPRQLTAAQLQLLQRAISSGRRSVYVGGAEKATAKALERAGYGRVGVDGWMLTFAPSPEGRAALEAKR